MPRALLLTFALTICACSVTPSVDAGRSGLCSTDDDCEGRSTPNCVTQHSGERACRNNCDVDRHCVGRSIGQTCRGTRLGDYVCGCETAADCPDPARPFCDVDAGWFQVQCGQCMSDAQCDDGGVCDNGNCTRAP